jgi:phospholipase C
VIDPLASRLTRRTLLRAGGGLALGAALGAGVDLRAVARGATLRTPDSVPDPSRPAGEPTSALPFDHVVIVMQENHSFDSYLGMLARRGQPLADGFTFDATGAPINSNPYQGGYATVQRVPSDCTLNGSGSQSWNDTHRQVNGGRMDGFAATGVDSLAYWDQPDLPFYYSLAKTFCLANRWFASAPCQTYPNRRFLQAGTAFGLVSTDTSSVTQYPPNGTIWDRLSSLGISWADYYTQVPTAAIIFGTVTKYPQNMLPIARFYADCAAGTLPAVSMVDSAIGAVGVLAGMAGLSNLPGAPNGAQPSSMDQDEENGNVSEGENFVSHVVNAVLQSPLWPRILLVWLYDEHGGNYDHVPPPAAIAPDSIPPRLRRGEAPGGYDVYGPRVPAVVVSGHARPRAVTDVVHDHTSILATIEAKWNVPALTHRDANAATLADFLVAGPPSFPEPPTLSAPSNEVQTQQACDPGPIDYVIHPYPPTRAHPAPRARLQLRVRQHRHHHPAGELVLELRSLSGPLTDIEVVLERGHRGHKAVTRARRKALGHTFERIVLRHRHLHTGRYSIVVKSHGRTLLVRRTHLTRSEV